MTDIAKLKALLEKATPGPWWHDDRTDHGSPLIFAGQPGDRGRTVVAFHQADYNSESWFDYEEPDAELIVEMRNALPRLIERVEAADKLAEKAQAAGFGSCRNPQPAWLGSAFTPELNEKPLPYKDCGECGPCLLRSALAKYRKVSSDA